MLHKALAADPAIDMQHEYAVQIAQPPRGAALSRPLRFAGSPENAGADACRGHGLQRRETLGRFVQQAVLADPGPGAASAQRQIRPSGARRSQGRRLLFPQARRRVLRRPLHGHPPGTLRRSGQRAPAAAGEEILVAGAAARRSGGGRLPPLQPVRAHVLALGRGEPRHPGGAGGAAAGEASFRPAGGAALVPRGDAGALWVPRTALPEFALRRIHEAAQRQTGRKTACSPRPSATASRPSRRR